MHRKILQYIKYINVREKCYVHKEKQAESQNREQHQREVSEVFTFFPVNVLLFIFCQNILKIYFELDIYS